MTFFAGLINLVNAYTTADFDDNYALIVDAHSKTDSDGRYSTKTLYDDKYPLKTTASSHSANTLSIDLSTIQL